MRSSILLAAIGIVFTSMLQPSANATVASTTLSGASFFRTDSTGNNINGGAGVLFYGGWTTVLDQQNIPGNYGYQFFLAQTPTPTPTSFLSPAANLSIGLNLGVNTFYFWGDNDDTSGGHDAFGLNLFFNGASALSPAISAYVAPGTGMTFHADSAPNTSGLNFHYVNGTGALSFLNGSELVTLTGFEVDGVGGAVAGPGDMDLVNSTNTAPFTPPPHPNGITDTYGQLTLTITTVPEPSSIALLMMGALGLFIVRRKFRFLSI